MTFLPLSIWLDYLHAMTTCMCAKKQISESWNIPYEMNAESLLPVKYYKILEL